MSVIGHSLYLRTASNLLKNLIRHFTECRVSLYEVKSDILRRRTIHRAELLPDELSKHD